MVRGIKKVGQLFVLTMAAHNLVRKRALAEAHPLSSKGVNESTSERRMCAARLDFSSLLVQCARNSGT